MVFTPGKSGNPGGRPKEEKEVKALARENSPHAFRKILELVDHPDPKYALAAACEVLDRAFGKSAQAITVASESNHYVLHVPLPPGSAQEWLMQSGKLKIEQSSSGLPNPVPKLTS